MYFILYIPGFNWASVTPQLSLFSMEPTWTPTKWVKAVESLYNKNNFFLILLSKRCDRYPFLLHKYEFLTIFLKSARRQYPRFETFGKKSNALMDLKHITFGTKIFLRASWPRGSFFWKNWIARWFSIGTIIMTISVSTDGFSQKKSAAVPYKCDFCLLLVVFVHRISNIEPWWELTN